MTIRHATDDDFTSVVLSSDRPVVVDFWAAWCGPCKALAPEIERLAMRQGDAIDVVKVDVDANPALSSAYNIMSIPLIVLFKPGEQPQGLTGFRTAEDIESAFGLTPPA
jgi:thioredoxin 1